MQTILVCDLRPDDDSPWGVGGVATGEVNRIYHPGITQGSVDAKETVPKAATWLPDP